MKSYQITSPVKDDEIRRLQLGDTVYISGKAFTCRSKLQRAVFDESFLLPDEFFEYDILIHTGPIILKEQEKYKLVSFMPTSSIRFEKWGARSVKEWGLKVIVGKTTMGEQTANAMREAGCVHLSPRSVSPNLWASCIRIDGVSLYEEMGAIEAPWKLILNELGPFIVDIDARGNRLFETLDQQVHSRLDSEYKKLGIPDDFKYTQLY
jgi:tartrate/fumarate subfamily iron-sulfur-dependent hydro-lyase beta chain